VPDSAAIDAHFAAQIVEKRLTDAMFVAALGRQLRVEKVAYASTDGLTIPAYLFAPRDTTVRWPTVLFV
jgi:dipeptidyl aminopeptidase/acylaminoacyl peptidase